MQIVFTLPMRNSHLSRKQCGKALQERDISLFTGASSLASRRNEKDWAFDQWLGPAAF
jgi:hypothetical protein